MGSIVDVALKSNSLETFTTALQVLGLEATLRGPGLFTIFAPTNHAFLKLPVGTVTALSKDVPKLVAVVACHLVAGKLTVKILQNLNSIQTIQGQVFELNTLNKILMVGDIELVQPALEADNGIIYPINSLLLPGKLKPICCRI